MQDIIFTVWINEHFDYQLDVVHWAVLFHFLFFLFFLHLLIIFWQIQNLCEIVIQMESEICILEVKITETSILDKFYWYVSIPVFVQMITNAWGQNLCSEGKNQLRKRFHINLNIELAFYDLYSYTNDNVNFLPHFMHMIWCWCNTYLTAHKFQHHWKNSRWPPMSLHNNLASAASFLLLPMMNPVNPCFGLGS